MVDLLEKIVRERIYDSVYWKTCCYGVNAASFCNRCADLTSIGGLHGYHRATPFLCLVLKLILINPPREIIDEMIKQKYFKYLTAVALVFVRLKYDAVSIYRILEPFLADYRKLRYTDKNSVEYLWHVDELVESLLTKDRALDIALPRIPLRIKLEEIGLEPREPLIDEDEFDLVHEQQ